MLTLRAITRVNRSVATAMASGVQRTLPTMSLTTVVPNIRIGTMDMRGRSYHTYPDADDKGVETHATAKEANVAKQILDKSGQGFILDKKFKIGEIFPGVPQGTKVKPGADVPKTLHTILPSGLTIASQDMPGLMTSFAFMVGTGSSYECQDGSTSDNTGVTQLLELTAFKSTIGRDETNNSISQAIEQLGGMVQCIATRENVMYCVDVLRENLEPALDILADTICRPQFTPEEVEDAKNIARLMVDEMPSDILSRDAAVIAAYKGSPLGNYHYIPIDKIDALNSQMLKDFHKHAFVGSNTFIAAAGVEHEIFVKLVKDRFGEHIPRASIGLDRETIRTSRKHIGYTGGMFQVERKLKEPFVKVALSFEVGGWNGPNIIPLCVLNQLLGGGSSFSAGGPGKGMYTRLYTQVLNTYSFAESMESFIALNEDCGMLGIDAACPPEYASHILRIIIDQLVKISIEPVTCEEINRAKNMCKSMMLMQLESRVVLCEDIARQYVSFGHRKDPHSICKLIDQVTKEDLLRVAKDMLRYPPSIGCVGHDLSHVPKFEDINAFVKMYVEESKKAVKGRTATGTARV